MIKNLEKLFRKYFLKWFLSKKIKKNKIQKNEIISAIKDPRIKAKGKRAIRQEKRFEYFTL